MLSFKQFYENLLEWTKREAPSDPKELDAYLSGEPSRDSAHPNYEDKFAHGIKALKNDVHGKEMVRKHLERFANHSNSWVRKAAAESAHIHEHPDLVEKLRADKSVKVTRAIDAPRKKTVVAPVAKPVAPKEEKPEVKKVAAPKAEKPAVKKAAIPKAQKPAAGTGSYSAEKVNPDDTGFSGATNVTHILHNGKVIGASVSSQHGSD